ncbi:MAG: polysaccharide biosynthesis tyrosine autokinase [Desulfobacterales bacterium]|nr:polysaccharide biosynthesis tyrosine autokinase [Desulfobacterales bacterium]
MVDIQEPQKRTRKTPARPRGVKRLPGKTGSSKDIKRSSRTSAAAPAVPEPSPPVRLNPEHMEDPVLKRRGVLDRLGFHRFRVRPQTPGNAPAMTGQAESDCHALELNRLHTDIVTLHRPYSFESEQFKILKTSILCHENPPKVIMVTSAVPGDGKSFVASNLAVSIAQNINEFVLLVDCDIRKPTIHTRFGLPQACGLSEYLANGKPLGSLLQKTAVKKLTILPGGKPPHNPSELLSSERMTMLLNEIKKRYKDRYVIIDTPPPLLVAETRALAKQVDGIVVVVRYRSTPRKMIKDLMGLLDPKKILGLVFNQIDEPSATYFGPGSHMKYKNYYAGYRQDHKISF